MTIPIAIRPKIRVPSGKLTLPSGPDPVSLVVSQNEDHTYTIFGVDAAGVQNTITQLVTAFTVTSSNSAVIESNVLAPLHFKAIPTGPGTANLVAAITLRSAVVMTVTLPFTVYGSLALGLTPAPGTPTAA